MTEDDNNLKDPCEKSKVGATSGKRFNGLPIYQFDNKLFRFRDFVQVNTSSMDYSELRQGFVCDKWSVVTTIYDPSEAIIKQAMLPGWCIVIVADLKTPTDFEDSLFGEIGVNTTALGHNASSSVTISSSNSSKDEILDPDNITTLSKTVVFLSPDEQVQLAEKLPFIDFLPWNSFARKNVGYIYAILHGAEYIWDFDDDNVIINSDLLHYFTSNSTLSEIDVIEPFSERFRSDRNYDFISSANISRGHSNARGGQRHPRRLTKKDIDEEADHLSNSFNPYPLMGAPYLPSWPRGRE